MQSGYQFQLFSGRLPFRLACTDDLEAGQHYEGRRSALRRAYLDPNPRNLIWAMIYDLDRPSGALAWEDADMPQPNWTTQNPANAHAHLGYTLTAPVSRSLRSRGGPQRYLARIQAGMTKALDADRAYTHHLTKTPDHPRWRTLWGRADPYELDELRDYLGDHLPLRLRRSEAVGEGRNVTLFDGLRHWAYRARLAFGAWPAWLEACRARADALNAFACPLPASEVRATSKSVAKWTWAHITPDGFVGLQRARGLRSGAARAAPLIDIQGELLR